MRTIAFSFVSLALASVATGASTATSETFDLDTVPTYVVSAPLSINYSPTWIDGVDGTGAAAAIYAVAHAGMEQPVTTLVYRAAADATGTCTYSPLGGTNVLRLVLSVEKDSAVLGSLTRDVAFGVSGTKASFSADSRTTAIQAVADATGKVPVAYDATWTSGAVSMRLDAVNRTREKRGPVVVTTNAVASALIGADVQEWTVPNEDGFDRLLLTFLDGNGQPVGETLESPWFEKFVPRGLLLLFR